MGLWTRHSPEAHKRPSNSSHPDGAGVGPYVAFVQIQMRGLPMGGPPDVAYERSRPMPEGNRALRCLAYAPEYGSTAGQRLAPGATLLGRDHRETLTSGGRGATYPARQEASVGEV